MKINRTEDLGALVRDRRRQLGLSQVELAKRMGARQAWVSRLEQGLPTLQIGLVFRALRDRGVSLSADTAEASAPTKRPPPGKRPPISLEDIVDG